MDPWFLGAWGDPLPSSAEQLEPNAHWNHNLSGPPGQVAQGN